MGLGNQFNYLIDVLGVTSKGRLRIERRCSGLWTMSGAWGVVVLGGVWRNGRGQKREILRGYILLRERGAEEIFHRLHVQILELGQLNWFVTLLGNNSDSELMINNCSTCCGIQIELPCAINIRNNLLSD